MRKKIQACNAFLLSSTIPSEPSDYKKTGKKSEGLLEYEKSRKYTVPDNAHIRYVLAIFPSYFSLFGVRNGKITDCPRWRKNISDGRGLSSTKEFSSTHPWKEKREKGRGRISPFFFCGASTETADSHPSSFGAEVAATAAEEGGTPPHLTLTVWTTGGGFGGREKITFQSPFVLISDTFPHTLSRTHSSNPSAPIPPFPF